MRDDKILVVASETAKPLLQAHLNHASVLRYATEEDSLQNRRLLLVFQVGTAGIDPAFYTWMDRYEKRDACAGSVGALVLFSQTESFTKRFAQEVVYLLNEKGMAWIPHALVEVLPGYVNFKTWQKARPLTLEAIFRERLQETIDGLFDYRPLSFENPRFLVLHASNYATSNTWTFFKALEKELAYPVEAFHVEDGTIVDCGACPYQTCLHFSEHKSCFYGGVMVEELFPQIEAADVTIWLCPNYNDALSAKLMAVVNRLTVLYRRISFREKAFYAVVVSGNSGGDSVAKQLMGALNFNKGFFLPPRFSTSAIANDPGSILKNPDFDRRVKAFAAVINGFSKECESRASGEIL